MARARLRDRHQESLRRKLELLKAEQAVNIPTSQETQSSANIALSTERVQAVPGTSAASEDHLSENEGYFFFLSNISLIFLS